MPSFWQSQSRSWTHLVECDHRLLLDYLQAALFILSLSLFVDIDIHISLALKKKNVPSPYFISLLVGSEIPEWSSNATYGPRTSLRLFNSMSINYSPSIDMSSSYLYIYIYAVHVYIYLYTHWLPKKKNVLAIEEHFLFHSCLHFSLLRIHFPLGVCVWAHKS